MNEFGEIENAGPAGWVIKRFRDDASGVDYLNVSFPRSGGGIHRLTLPMSSVENPAEIAKALLNAGAALPEEREKRKKVVEWILAKVPNEAGHLATATGWQLGAFLLGERVYGKADLMLHPDLCQMVQPIGVKHGTQREWQTGVAKVATGSSYASFAIMHALAAPLFRFSKLPEGAIFHFAAPSSTGKTTAVMAGASVWGNPSVPTDWNGTDRGLQELAATRSDIQLILDDTERMRNSGDRLKMLTRAAHILTSGRSDRYSGSVKSQLRSLEWRCWAISTGPFRIDQEFSKTGRTRSKGDRARLIDIPVPDANDGGIWDRLTGLSQSDGAALSEKLTRSSTSYHGHLSDLWVQHLVEHQTDLADFVEKRFAFFLKKLSPNDVGGVERRIALKFALVYAAGKLAIEHGFLPWEKSHPLKICARLCRKALRSEEDTLHKRTGTDALRTIDDWIDENRFPNFLFGESPSFPKGSDPVGFISIKRGRRTLYVQRAELEEHFGQRTSVLIEALQECGALKPGQGSRTGVQKRVSVGKDESKVRFVAIDVSTLKRARGSR